MTDKEYSNVVTKFTELMALVEDEKMANDIYDVLSQFQMKYMKNILAEYREKIKTKAQEYIYDLFENAVLHSETGQSAISCESEELANEVYDTIFEEIGEYLLDDCQMYEEKGEWVVDVIFGGNYIPYWDGFMED